MTVTVDLIARYKRPTNTSALPGQANACISRRVLSNGYLSYRPEWPGLEALHSAEHKTMQVSEDYEMDPQFKGWYIVPNEYERMKKGKAKKTSVPKKEKTDREIVWWLKFEDKDDTADVKGQKSERESLREEGKFVDRNGVAVWRKKKRFRGSGSIEMLDDPIRHGWELAFAEDELASDSWREKRVARHAPQENWNVTDLRYDLGEREEGFRLEDIVHHEPNYYTVKMAREKWPKKRVVMENTSGLEDSQHLSLPSLSRPESAMDCGISSGGSESGCECDFLLELDEEPLEGWVPVMVREDHHDEEGWVSLTGSWMLMGGPDDRKRNLRVVNV